MNNTQFQESNNPDGIPFRQTMLETIRQEKVEADNAGKGNGAKKSRTKVTQFHIQYN